MISQLKIYIFSGAQGMPNAGDVGDKVTHLYLFIFLITRLYKYIRDLIIFQGGTGGSKGCTRSNKNDDQRLWKGPWQLLLIRSDVK